MKAVYFIPIIAAILLLRVFMSRRRRRRRDAPAVEQRSRRRFALGAHLGDVGLVARREILERVRGRIFRVGTIIILLIVAGAIVIPKIHSSSTTPPQQVGVVGGSTGSAATQVTQVVKYSGKQSQTPVHVVSEPSVQSAEAALRSGKLDVVVVNGDKIVTNQPVAGSTSDTATLVQVLAPELGVLNSYQRAGLSPQQIGQVAQARAVPVQSLLANNNAKRGVN